MNDKPIFHKEIESKLKKLDKVQESNSKKGWKNMIKR